MERQVNVHEAKPQLSRLLEDVSASRASVARLVRYEPSGGPRVPGAWRGRLEMADDFDEMPTHLGAAFRGEEP